MRIAKILCVAIAWALSVPAAGGYEYGTIVLTDGKGGLRLPQEVAEAASNDSRRLEMLRARDDNRRRHLAGLRRTIDDVEANGFTVSDESMLSAYDGLVGDIRRQRTPGAIPQGAAIEPGFRPAELVHPVFARGRKLGRLSLSVADGYAHELATAYEFDDLGVVIIEELSYSTVPDTRIVVTRPVGNLYVNGYPATYTAHVNSEGTRGLSSIMYITESKLIRVVVLACITRDDRPRFERFVELAAAVR